MCIIRESCNLNCDLMSYIKYYVLVINRSARNSGTVYFCLYDYVIIFFNFKLWKHDK